MPEHTIRALLIDDDEDDYIFVRNLLLKSRSVNVELGWIDNYDDALKEIENDGYDVYFLDYRLGGRNGLALLKDAVQKGCTAPIIFLTGQGSYAVDLEAMRGGAADYLVKDELNERLLERSVRYAVERNLAKEALQKSQQELQNLSLQLLSAQESERQLVAWEIHDSIGQMLAAIKFSIENGMQQIQEGAAQKAAEVLGRASKMTRKAIAHVRRIQTNLHPPIIDDMGILPAIEWFCRGFHKNYPAIGIDQRLEIEESIIPKDLRIVIFRIIQEAFDNIVKHSGARRIRLELIHRNASIELVIKDNGRGFDPAELFANRIRTMGISGMKERAKLSGGGFSMTSAKKSGTTIAVSWPTASFS